MREPKRQGNHRLSSVTMASRAAQASQSADMLPLLLASA